MPKRTCEEPNCTRPHQARGLCISHYNRLNYTPEQRHPKYRITCEGCGAQYMAARPEGRFCSLICREVVRASYARATPVPDLHPSRSSPVPTDHPSRTRPTPSWPVFYGDCVDCGGCFSSNTPTKIHCSKRCSKRSNKRARRGREFGQGDSFTWTQFMTLFLAFGRCCAYCGDEVPGQPEPDHVVPLSRGGHNTISNILPACRACNSDKRDLSLTEWAADRVRTRKPVVVTVWPVGDRRYVHLALRPIELRDAA